MQMQLQHIPIHPHLRSYIEKIWIFESNGKLPEEDMKLIVPNGLVKMIIPFKNGVSGKVDHHYLLSKEHQIILIGITDLPAVVDIENDSPSGSIGIEFKPSGAYRFFHLRYSEIKNQIQPFSDILGKTAKQIEEQIANTDDILKKADIVQQFLIDLLIAGDQDPIFEYCVHQLCSTKGTISIRQLEKETGYSSRWLNMKFSEKVGASPKSLASILRFQECYRALIRNTDLIFDEKEFYKFYYDQSHFIKEFKRFTGLSPSRFEKLTNNFGKIFYRK